MNRAAVPARSCALHSVRFSLLCCVLLTLALSAFAQHAPSVLVPGSPQSIFVMMEDSQSRLWLGTIDDFFCFDGTHFYSLRPYGFPRETANSIAEDAEGGIWIGTQGTDANGGSRQGALYRYQSGKVERILAGDSLSIISASSGFMLASIGTEASGKPTYGDLYRIEKTADKWTPVLLQTNLAHHMSIDHEGNVLFPCPNGWCEVPADQVANWKPKNLPPGFRKHTGDPLTEKVIRDRYGCVWFRAEIRASYQCPADSQAQYLPYQYSQTDSSAHLEETPDGSVFMLVPLLLGRPGAFHKLDSAELAPAALDTAVVARDGTVWLGTARGLYRMPYLFRLETWGKQDGAWTYSHFIRNIDGRIFSDAKKITMLSPDRHKWITIPNTDRLRNVQDILGLPGKRILATAFDGMALYALDGTVLASCAPGAGIGFSLAQTRDGTIWFGGNGISTVHIQGRHILLVPEPVDKDRVLYMLYDAPRDMLWATDGSKLLFRKDGAWHSISQKDGLLDVEAGHLTMGPDGSIWLGYRNAAYAWIENPLSGHPIVHNFTHRLEDVVGSNGVNGLIFDRHNRLWLGNSVMNVTTSELATQDKWLRLTEQEGIPPLASLDSAMLADVDDSIWYINEDGIFHFSPPPDFATNLPVPTISISGLSIAAAQPQLSDTVRELPRNADITAYIGSMQFDRRSSIEVRYRLLPDLAWHSTDGMSAHLGKLSWGEHRLEVQARIAYGSWSTPAQRNIYVAKPLWLTWPALLLFTLMGGSSVETVRRWNKIRRERSLMVFPELSEWRLAALSPELHELDGSLLDGRFQVGRVLARGGFATVAEGRDMRQAGQLCAIKIFRRELVDKEWMARRFRQEVRALEQIHHPNVVRIHGSGALPNGTLYLVMEFIEGATLRELLDIGKLAPSRIAHFLRQAGSALDEIHRNGICHRDLKPENLMIRTASSGSEEIVLIDFSIAIVKDPDETLHGLSRAAGTIYYMAPEQAVGYADSSTDIYSLAKILIEMLTGQRLSVLLPDASIDLSERVRDLLQSLPLGLSSASIELISTALEFDPARRPRIAGLFAERVAEDLHPDLIRR